MFIDASMHNGIVLVLIHKVALRVQDLKHIIASLQHKETSCNNTHSLDAQVDGFGQRCA
jgi:hypothetical protein